MKKNKLKFLYCYIVILLLCFNIFVPTAKADIFDEIYKNLGVFTAELGLPGGEGVGLLDIIINIINIILTFLGILFIIMILYGGFTYMTAGGNPEKAKKAIGIIKDAVIGVIIVVLSGVFVNYVLLKIIEAVR